MTSGSPSCPPYAAGAEPTAHHCQHWLSPSPDMTQDNLTMPGTGCQLLKNLETWYRRLVPVIQGRARNRKRRPAAASTEEAATNKIQNRGGVRPRRNSPDTQGGPHWRRVQLSAQDPKARSAGADGGQVHCQGTGRTFPAGGTCLELVPESQRSSRKSMTYCQHFQKPSRTRTSTGNKATGTN